MAQLDPIETSPGQTEGRWAYLDNLRSFVIFLVVVMHSNVTYSGLGGWYYKEGNPDLLDLPSKFLFGLYGSFTQAWFMGILFFLSAYFAAGSLERRGPGAFVRERLVRLGLPLLLYVFVIDPFIAYFLMNYGNVQALGLGAAYLGYLASWDWVGSTGPLWFAEALLLFCLPYAAWRALKPRRGGPKGVPSTLTFVVIIAATGLGAFVLRLFHPIGTSVANLQFSFFASYIALFVLGVHAGENHWLEKLSDALGLRWFTAVLAGGIPVWLVIVVAGGVVSGEARFEGGLNPTSFAYAFWEAFVAIGFSLGLVVFFRRFVGGGGRLSQVLARHSFAVYALHAPVLVALSLVLRDWVAPALVKHAVVAPLAFVLTLGLGWLVLRIPGVRRVLR